MRRLFTLLTALAALFATAYGQTFSYSCDFEDATENANWIFVGGSYTNQWAIGSGTNNGGSHALYISNDGGTTNAYTVSTPTAQLVFAIRTFALGVGEYNVSYDWNCRGQNNSDFMRVAMVPSSEAETLEAAESLAGFSRNSMPSTWVPLDGERALCNVTSWNTQQATFSVTESGEYSLVFVWLNNKTSGTQPPAAVDNLNITLNDCMTPVQLHVGNITPHEATLSWSGAAGSTYEVRYSKVDNVDSAIVATPNNYTQNTITLTSLSQSTTYYAWVRPGCNTEWQTFEAFTTALSCAPVSGARVEQVDRHAAFIRWTTGEGAAYEQNSVIVTYSADSVAPRTISTTNSYTFITDLTTAKSYTVDIQAICEQDTANPITLVVATPGCDSKIGDGSDSDYTHGPSTNYRYAVNKWIYTAEELNLPAGYIGSITLDCAREPRPSFSNLTPTYKYYMANTTKSSFSSGDDDIPASSFTLVATSTQHYVLGNNTIIFSTPFYYDGVSNIAIAFSISAPAWDSPWDVSPYFFYTTTTNYTGHYQHNDDIAAFADLERPTGGYSYHFGTSNKRPNVGFPVSCDDSSNCFAPLVAVVSVDHESATIAWSRISNNVPTRVEYKLQSASSWTLLRASTFDDTVALSGLDPNTAYEFRVTNLCGDSTQAGYAKTRTLCGIYTFPYTERFSNPEALNCWTLYGQSHSTSYGSGSLYQGSSATNYAIMPEVDVVFGGLQVNLDIYSSSRTNTYVIIGVVTDPDNPDSTFYPFSDTLRNTTNNTFETFEVPIRYGGPEGRMAFKIISRGYSVYIDNIRLMNPPTCFKVSNIAVANIGTTYASVSWTDTVNPGIGDWIVQVGDSAYMALSSPFLVTGLDSNRTYTLSVRALCAADDTADAVRGPSFTTLRASPARVPYTETFENASTYAGWENSNYGSNRWLIGSATNNGGTHALYISNDNSTYYYSTSNTSNTFAWRDFYLDAGDYTVSYDWKAMGERSTTGTNYDYMRVALVPGSVNLYASSTIWSIPTGAFVLDGSEPLLDQSSWVTHNDQFSISSADIYHLVFYWHNDGTSGTQPPAAVDNIQVLMNTCPAPINLQISNITATTATATWTPIGTESAWIVRAGSFVDTAYVATYDFTSLEPSTTYQFSVTAFCDSDDQSIPVSTYATTLCQAVSRLPYTYGFEDASASGSSADINPCYTRLSSSSTRYPYPSTTAATGTYSLYFYASMSQYSCLVLPEFTTPIDSLEIMVSARLSGNYDDVNLRIGVMSDPDDFSTFTELYSEPVSSTDFNEYIYSLNNYHGDGGRIAIALKGNSTSSGYAYIDDIYVGLIPSCPRVSGVSVSSITTHEATVSWTGNDLVSAWLVEYSRYPWGDDESRYQSRMATTPTLDLTDLDSNATYYLRIQADCGLDGSSPYTYTQFTTLPYMPTLPPFTDGFEDSASYAGWVMVNIDSSYNHWNIGSATSNGGSKALYVAPPRRDTCSYTLNSGSNVYVYREFLLTAGRYVVSYDYKVGGSSSDYMRAAVVPVGSRIEASSSSYSSWTIPSGGISIDSNSTVYTTNGWHRRYTAINIRQEGRYYLVFYWHNTSSYYSTPTPPGACIDNVSVAPSNCQPPTGLSVSAVSGTTATVGWLEGDQSQWTVGLANSVNEYLVNTNSYTFSNLRPLSNYTFNVRAVCGPADTSAVASASFATPCPVVAESQLPLYEDFEDYSAATTAEIDRCWHRYTSGDRYYPFVTSFYHYSGQKSLNFPNTYDCFVTLPDIDVELARMQLSFVTRSLFDRGVDIEVGVMTDPDDVSTFTLVSTVVSDTVWRPVTIYFNAYTGPHGHIAIRGNHVSAYIDSVVAEIATGCPVPTNTRASEIDDTSALISWNGLADSYVLQYRTLGTTQWRDAGTSASTTHRLGGLLPITSYEVRVSGVCDGDHGDWGLPHTFVTAEAANGCNPVQRFEMGSVASIAAMVTWWYPDSVEGATFEVRYGLRDFDFESGYMGDTVVADTALIIEGLVTLTDYEVYCRVLCADGATSAWLGPIGFRTLGIDAPQLGALVSLYPNPASQSVTIAIERAQGQVNIDVVDLNGRTLISHTMPAADNRLNLDISNLRRGAYFVRIYGDGVSSVRKLIVK